MKGQTLEFGGDRTRGKNEVDHAGGDSASGHAEMLRAAFVLGKGEATLTLDLFQAQGAIGAGA